MPLPQPPKPVAAARGSGGDDSWETAASAPVRPSSRSRPAAAAPAPAAAAEGGAEAETLAFGGGHVLEFFDLTPAVRTQHLEAFLERLCSGHAAPPTLKWVLGLVLGGSLRGWKLVHGVGTAVGDGWLLLAHGFALWVLPARPPWAGSQHP